MSGSPVSPKYIKGALVEFSGRFLGPLPNVITFQYNPETVPRELKPWVPDTVTTASIERHDDGTGTITAAPVDPEESFSLELLLDASDALEFPDSHPVARLFGVADRIAALELLIYPDNGGPLGGELLAPVTGSLRGDNAAENLLGEFRDLVRKSVPVVLLVWGPGRIAPVRLKSFRVEEQAFSPLLYPTRAKASVGLQVLPPHALEGYVDGFGKQLAKVAYAFTQKQKEVLAAANLANAAESVLDYLPG